MSFFPDSTRAKICIYQADLSAGKCRLIFIRQEIIAFLYFAAAARIIVRFVYVNCVQGVPKISILRKTVTTCKPQNHHRSFETSSECGIDVNLCLASFAAIAKIDQIDLALDQRKFVIESILKVSYYKQCLIDSRNILGLQSAVVQSEKL